MQSSSYFFGKSYIIMYNKSEKFNILLTNEVTGQLSYVARS